jgi:CRP-like cAMP-binding protein
MMCTSVPNKWVVPADIPALADTLADSSQFFAQLTRVDLEALLELSTQRQIKAKKLICEKGDPGNELFIIIAGKLKARTTSDDGREVILGFIEEGEIFGEMAIIDGLARSADVVAVQDSEFLVIERKDFLPFLEAHPSASLGIMKALTLRLRKVDGLLEDTRFLDLKARLAKTLLQLTQDHGRTVVGGGIRIDFKVSQEELGFIVGATRENVNKLVRAWVEEGVLETSQSTVIVRKPEALLAV